MKIFSNSHSFGSQQLPAHCLIVYVEQSALKVSSVFPYPEPYQPHHSLLSQFRKIPVVLLLFNSKFYTLECMCVSILFIYINLSTYVYFVYSVLTFSLRGIQIVLKIWRMKEFTKVCFKKALFCRENIVCNCFIISPHRSKGLVLACVSVLNE